MARWGAGCRPDRGKPVGRGASTTPAYGRHVAGTGWSEAGARARERGEGEPGRAVWLGRKGGGSAQQRLPPFFLKLFSQKLKCGFLKLLQIFLGVGVKRRIVPHKIPYNFALIGKVKFQIEFESQIKTSSRFLINSF